MIAFVPACAPVDLRQYPAMLQGATGSMLGGVMFRNVSDRRCAVGARPRVKLVLARHRLDVQLGTFPLSQIGGRTVSTIGPGRRAGIYLVWHNWCGDWPAGSPVQTARLRLVLTTGFRLTAWLRTGRPRCDDPSSPSELDVSPFGTAR